MTPEERERLEGLLSDAADEAPPESLRDRVLSGRVPVRRRTRRAPGLPAGAPWIFALGTAAALVLLVVLAIVPRGRPSLPVTPPSEVRAPALPEVPLAAPPGEPPPPPPRPPETPPVPPPPAREAVPATVSRPPAAEPEPPRPRPAEGTRPEVPAVAVLREAEGPVDVSGEAAREGRGVGEGQGVRTGPAGRAALAFPDGTCLTLSAETSVRRLEEAHGKRITLDRGTLAADVTKQPAGSPLVVVTPHAEATVAGTRFTLRCGPESTRLDVAGGRVRLKRLSDGAAATVSAGQYAVASRESRPSALPLPPPEIVLLPAQGRIAGAEWRLAPDPAASSGAVLETTRFDEKTGGMKTSRSFVSFSFHAEADRDYRVWVRGRCLETRETPAAHDAVAILPVAGRFSRACVDAKTQGSDAYLFNGYGDDPGLRDRYFWIGGNGLGESVTLRFARPGLQTIQLHAMESPVRIDAIWLSTAQAARPEPDAKPPK